MDLAGVKHFNLCTPATNCRLYNSLHELKAEVRTDTLNRMWGAVCLASRCTHNCIRLSFSSSARKELEKNYRLYLPIPAPKGFLWSGSGCSLRLRGLRLSCFPHYLYQLPTAPPPDSYRTANCNGPVSVSIPYAFVWTPWFTALRIGTLLYLCGDYNWKLQANIITSYAFAKLAKGGWITKHLINYLLCKYISQ